MNTQILRQSMCQLAVGFIVLVSLSLVSASNIIDNLATPDVESLMLIADGGGQNGGG